MLMNLREVSSCREEITNRLMKTGELGNLRAAQCRAIYSWSYKSVEKEREREGILFFLKILDLSGAGRYLPTTQT